MDKINTRNLVELLKDRCGKLDVSNETEYPTTRALLMHSALLIEKELLNVKRGTLGYFILYSPFTYSTKVIVVRHSETLVPMTDFGKLIDILTPDLFDLEIDYAAIIDFMPSSVSDVLVPALEIHLK